MCAAESTEARVQSVIAVLKVLEKAQGELITLHKKRGQENFTIDIGGVLPVEGPEPIRPQKDECWPGITPFNPVSETWTYEAALEFIKKWIADCWMYLEDGHVG